MNRIAHSLVGYDRRTERVAEEFDVPDIVLPKAKELACVPADDPDAMMCYPLDERGAQYLADMLKAKVDTGQRDYFLEGFSYLLAEDAEFRLDGLEWSVWIHDDAEGYHVKVSVARSTLDDYASKHGHKDHQTVVNLLNGIPKKVQKTVNRAINDGRANAGRIELTSDDLGAILER